MDFLDGKRFSVKNLDLALTESIEKFTSEPWKPDYTHLVDKSPNSEAESRARRDGKILAMTNLRDSLTGGTKAEIKELIKQKMNEIKDRENFTLQTGWHQVNGRGVEKNLAYGQFSRLKHIYTYL